MPVADRGWWWVSGLDRFSVTLVSSGAVGVGIVPSSCMVDSNFMAITPQDVAARFLDAVVPVVANANDIFDLVPNGRVGVFDADASANE